MSTTPKQRKLTNGKSIWTLTRVSDFCFTAVNGFGKKHKWTGESAMDEVIAFEDFLCSKGFTLIERGRSLNTLVRMPAAKQMVIELASV